MIRLMRWRTRKSSAHVFYLILGSVFTFMLLAFTLIHTVAYQSMRTAIRKTHMAEMTQLIQSSEHAYNSYVNMLSQLLINTTVREFSYDPSSSEPGERYTTRTLRQKLMSILPYNTDAKYIYIWYPETNVVVGSNACLMTMEEWFDQTLSGAFSDANALRLFASSLNGVVNFIYQDSRTTMPYLVLCGRNPGTGYASATAYIFLLTDARCLLSGTGTLPRNSVYSTFWLTNDANEVVLQLGDEQFLADVDLSDGMAEANGTVYLQQRSSVTGFTYRAAYPERAYYAPLHTTSLILWIISGLSLALTLAALLRYAIWHFGKLNRLSLLAAPYADSAARVSSPSDEVDVIEHALYDVLGRNNALSHRLTSQQAIARAAYLGKVLSGALHLLPDDLERVNSDMGMHLRNTWFAMIILRDERENDVSMAQSRVQSLSAVAEEALAEEAYSAYEAYTPEGVGLILNFDSDSQAEAALDSLADRLLTAIAELDIEPDDVTIAIGSAHEGVEALSQVYSEAREALVGRYFMPGSVLYYHDVLTRRQSRYIAYPLAVEQKLLNRIVCGDADGARELLEQIWVENPQVMRDSGKEERALLGSEIQATLLKAAMEMEMRDSCGEEPQTPQRLRPGSFKTLRESTVAAIEALCAASHESAKSRHWLADKVYAYIRENYADPALNVTQLGDIFHFSPFYLSRVFKNDTGIAVTDAIVRERMARADALLRESDIPIQQIGLIVGYQEYSTFARAFKQHLGVAPSRVRRDR